MAPSVMQCGTLKILPLLQAVPDQSIVYGRGLWDSQVDGRRERGWVDQVLAIMACRREWKRERSSGG
jgi:hypothetical protein